LDVEPAGQGVQLLPLLNVFLGQVEQLCPFDAGTDPPGHAAQEADPELLMLPGGQSVQNFTPEGAYVPSGHSAHCPDKGIDPAGHFWVHWPGGERCIKRERR
jgi:hypothetical protein